MTWNCLGERPGIRLAVVLQGESPGFGQAGVGESPGFGPAGVGESPGFGQIGFVDGGK